MATEKTIFRRKVFGYLIGMVPLTLFAGFFGIAYAKFFFHYLALKPIYYYIGLVIYAFINMFNDPIIGNMSDNTDAKRWGSRRIIYIKIGAPLITVAFLAIWWLPTDHGIQWVYFLHFVLTICFYETFFTMITMTWYALLPEMTIDVDQRARINFIGTIIILVSGLPIILISTLDFEQIKYWSLFVAGIGFVCYIFVIIFSKESPEFHQEKATPLWESVKQTWKNKAYRRFMGYNFLTMIGDSINSAYLFLFWFWIGEENILYYFLIVVVVGYGSNILCLSLRKKYGIVKIITFFNLMRFLGAAATFVLVLFPATEKLIWIGLVWIYFFNGQTVFNYILQTAPIDQDEMLFGSRREGMFFGINALFTMPANSIGPIIGAVIMLAFGYSQGADAALQEQTVFTGIKFIFVLLPHVLGLIAILVIRGYPLDNVQLDKIRTTLEEIHEEKRKRAGIITEPINENTPG
jgi:glycoside/pentoside/hexuronide:cation symporter, GPH family